MKLLRAIGLGILFWVIIFVEISVTMIGFKLSSTTIDVINYSVIIPLSGLVAWLYYKSKDKINGFLLGLIIVIVGTILDMIITVPFFIMPQGGNYATYFSSFYLIAGYLEAILVIGLYDLARKKR